MRTDFLFVQPSVLRGVGRLLDFWGQLSQYNFSVSAAEADIIALRSDWEMIAQDFRSGLSEASRPESQLPLFE
ncbi:MAG TPA: hypothetical protein VJZ00_23170 [Thermoanaerobaculia bacterium]|nr:hypothetical protein [Thermoanaerobaculia bacterium]